MYCLDGYLGSEVHPHTWIFTCCLFNMLVNQHTSLSFFGKHVFIFEFIFPALLRYNIDTCADKARDFIWKGHPGGEQEGQGTQENCSAVWLEVSFYGDGISFRWSLANHSNSESFLVVHTSLSQDGC